jgi:hypothetical protein
MDDRRVASSLDGFDLILMTINEMITMIMINDDISKKKVVVRRIA